MATMPAGMLGGPAFFKGLPSHHGFMGCYLQPKAIWIVSWRAASVLSLRTRSRRQIMGLICRIQTWSR